MSAAAEHPKAMRIQNPPRERLALVVAAPFDLRLRIEAEGERITACRYTRAATSRADRRTPPVLREAAHQITAYCRKRLQRFDLPMELHGPPLWVAAWRFVAGLEFGEVISYSDAARALGRPGAHRAVAAAMRETPYDLIVPAHRVIGADGTIRGDGGMRRRLLAFEGYRGKIMRASAQPRAVRMRAR